MPPVRGLSSAEAKKRLQRYGQNLLTVTPEISAIGSFVSRFQLQMVLLLAGAVLLLAVNIPVAITIIVFVLGMALVDTYRDLQVKKSIVSIQNAYVGYTTVIRDGLKKNVRVSELVPGDIVLLSEGARVPTDGTVIETKGCKVDEKIFGRETVSKRSVEEEEKIRTFEKKTEDRSRLFAGTFVVEGGCIMEVTSTGASTMYFKFVGAVEPEQSAAVVKVENLVSSITPLVLGLAAVVFFLNDISGVQPLDAFLIAAAAAVAGMPQSIGIVAQTAFSTTLERISRGVALRRQRLVDKLGDTTVICTEKVRALSRGEPTVHRIFIDGVDAEVSGEGWNTTGEFSGIKNFDSLDFLTNLTAIATEAMLFGEEKEIVSGDPTEGALIVLSLKNNQPVESLRGQYPSIRRSYDPKTKVTTSVNRWGAGRITCIFGPAEKVLNLCDHVHINGKAEAMKGRKTELEHKAIAMAADGFEPFAVGYQEGSEEYTFLALLGIYDPPKPEIQKIISESKEAGIRLVILTEEDETTAVQFARQLGIMTEGTRAVICSQLDDMKAAERVKTIKTAAVFADATSVYKRMIIEQLKAAGAKVAFIDSGAVDIQAIVAADASLALESATDISKYNSDGILLNDDFYGAPAGIEESRALKENIERSFYGLLVQDLSIIFVILLLSALELTPINVLQILFINAAADSAIGIGLAFDRIPRSMLLKPRQKKFPAAGEFTFAFVLSVFAAVAAFAVAAQQPAELFSTTIIASLTAFFIATMLNFSSMDDSIFSARPSSRLIAAVAVIMLATILLIYSPLNTLFGLRPLPLSAWMGAAAVAASAIVIVEVKKTVFH